MLLVLLLVLLYCCSYALERHRSQNSNDTNVTGCEASDGIGTK